MRARTFDIAINDLLHFPSIKRLADVIVGAESQGLLGRVECAETGSTDRNKPRITLSAKPVREGQYSAAVVVTVRDNGSGISPEIKEKIFSPFCTTKPRGMGLGLPIVKRTVFDHHGRVEVDSTSKGTQVSVLLPATSGQG